jgi:predicted  nucleic acid-binding Zn-ribbon protein
VQDVIQIEPRIALVEHRVEEHTQAIGGLREAVVSLDQRVQGLDQRVGRLEDRVGRLEDRVGRLEERVDRGFDRVDRRFDALDEKMSRQFRWQTGILLSGLIAMMGTLGGIIAVLIRR